MCLLYLDPYYKMECSVCEKAMYGHVEVAKSAEIVCGSCALTSTAKGKKKPKIANVETMQVELFKESMKQPERSEVKEPIVSKKIKVKSNYARNRVVVIGGNVVMTFNEDGECQIDAKHKPALEVHMRLRPNRFKIVDDAPPPVVEEKPVEEVKEPEAVEEAKEPEEVVVVEEDKPAVEEAPKPKKAAKKTKKKKSKKASK